MFQQSEFGTALPWYFPLMKTYWFPENGSKAVDQKPSVATLTDHSPLSETVEKSFLIWCFPIIEKFS